MWKSPELFIAREMRIWRSGDEILLRQDDAALRIPVGIKRLRAARRPVDARRNSDIPSRPIRLRYIRYGRYRRRYKP